MCRNSPAGDLGTVSVNGGSPVSLTGTGNFSIQQYLDAGQSFEVAYVGGSNNGFSFDGFTVSVIPEPSTLLLATGGLVGLCLRRRRKA